MSGEPDEQSTYRSANGNSSAGCRKNTEAARSFLGNLLREASDEGLLAILDAIEAEMGEAVAEARQTIDLLGQVAAEIYRRQREADLSQPRPTVAEGLEPAADEYPTERPARH
jgi:hypothetical protein